MSENLTPAVRFNGFTDDWEQRRLGELFSERSERSSVGELISVTINQGVVKASELDRKDNSSSDKSNYKKVEIGDIAYNSMRMWQGASGYSPYSGILSPAYTVIFPKKKQNIIFWSYKLKTDAMLYKFRINSQGLTSDTWNLKYPLFSKIKVFSARWEEQNKIASLLSTLDDLIALRQRKLELLQQLKKAMLQQMFPAKDSNIPQLRFNGFNDTWKQRRLEDYLTVSQERNSNGIYDKADVLSVSGDFGIVNQIEFQGRSFAGVSVSNYGVVHTGDVVYTKSPLRANPYGIIKTNKGKTGIVSTLYAVYHAREEVYPDFIQVYFEQNIRMNNYMRPLANKGAKNDMKVSAENALKGIVCFPCCEEQITISIFFQQLDNLITLHQRRCEKLDQLKKHLLQTMFV